MDPTLLATSEAHKGELIPVGSKTTLPTNSEVVHTGSTVDTGTQEDWLAAATADPASWLKGIDR
jgi:hypothetical protein